ncbi:FAD-dependent oxidoreductase [Salinibacterium sp. ZJ70]|uniref:FAD-dependent oxidoreductase n=1 Tax=Salinibacterium sp. ZJ70 TaxID=2708084 RepID=UPI001423EA9D|nr:FAD-dependent oxidoreductase [Salinibacterium sp. ZJ70]
MSWVSVFDTDFDTVVFGGGYAGVAAALERRSVGDRVLLVATRGDILWESGQAFAREIGESASLHWQELIEHVARRGGRGEETLDGAIAELVGMRMLQDAGVRQLHFARPVAVSPGHSGIGAVTVAGKFGTRTVRGRGYVDATETGELLRLIDPAVVIPGAARVRATAMLQHPDWPAALEAELSRTAWDGERVVEVETGEAGWRDVLLAEVDRVCRKLGEDARRVCVSHLSGVPLPMYDTPVEASAAAANVAAAVPALAAASGPGARFDLGAAAAGVLVQAPSSPDARGGDIAVIRELSAEVVVAGVGTGGVLAVAAAAEQGATVIGIEALAFPGGVGPAAAIHAYWFGAPGGMQSELDEATHDVMKQHDRGPFRDGPYNPWAKRTAVEATLDREGVRILADAVVFAAERDGDAVVSVLAATADGVVRVHGKVFIDGTGDGDLCALAGAEFEGGRVGDALLHAYSQSGGRLREVGSEARMDVINFDAGYCDPTDPDDLTRARIDGVLLYLVDGAYSNLDRPTYIAPLVGVRQGRRVRTDLWIELDDVVRRRRFPDAIGYTASHIDSHGSDFEFDTDESVFWQQLIRAWGVSVSSELSYRMLLPLGLANVLIASRCLGATQDAGYAVRMQRDIQRIGEVAGRAAALALDCAGDVREIPLEELQRQLEVSGALGRPPRALERGFGVAHDTADAPHERTGFDVGAADAREDGGLLLRRALKSLDEGTPSEAIWWLFRHEEIAREAVLQRLTDPRPMTSWLAAGIGAMWADPAAQPRLLHAIATAEYGFDDLATRVPAGTGKYVPKDPEPLTWHKLTPNWLTAIALLRRCGDAEAISALEQFIEGSERLGLSTATTTLLTIERLFERGVGAAEPQRIAALVDAIEALPLEGVVDYTSRASGYFAEAALRGQTPEDWADFSGLNGVKAQQLRNMYVDMSWQVALVAARVRSLLGQRPDIERYLVDPRGFVRTAFQLIAEGEE